MSIETWQVQKDAPPGAGQGLRPADGLADLPAKFRMDAAETSILQQQLEEMELEVFQNVYADVKTPQIIPIDSSGDPAAETNSWRTSDVNAKWGLLADDGAVDDGQSQSRKRQKESVHYYSFQHVFGWSLQDVRRAQRAGIQLSTEQPLTARESWDETLEDIIANGYAGTDLRGLLDYPGIDLATEPTAWEDVTSGSDLVAKMMSVFSTRNEELEMVEQLMPNRMVLPPSIYNHANDLPFTTSTDSGKSALDVFVEKARKVVPDFQVTWWRKCRDAGAAGTVHRSLLYRLDPRILKAKVSVPFEMLPVEAEGFRFKVPCHARTAGVQIMRPLGVKYIDIPPETP